VPKLIQLREVDYLDHEAFLAEAERRSAPLLESERPDGQEDSMKRRPHTPEQIVRKLREADWRLGLVS
jgi:hypothetical protein